MAHAVHIENRVNPVKEPYTIRSLSRRLDFLVPVALACDEQKLIT
jgi:hypothetical protein